MDEFKKLPPVTRSLLLGVAGVTGGTLLQLLSIYPIVFIPSKIARGEIWRLVTPFLWAGKGLPMVFDVFLFFRNLNSLEESHFQRKTADLVWCLIIVCGAILGINYPLKSLIMFRPLMVGLTHLWAQSNATSQVSLFGLINIPAPYFPFALLGMDLVQAGPGMAMRSGTGLVAAHLYWFLFQIYPRQNGGRPLSFLATPQFLIQQFGNGPTSAAGGTYQTSGGWAFRTGRTLGGRPGSSATSGVRGTAPVAAAGGRTTGSTATNTSQAGTTAQHRWGSGNRLGTDEQ